MAIRLGMVMTHCRRETNGLVAKACSKCFAAHSVVLTMIVQTTFSCPLNASLSGDARRRERDHWAVGRAIIGSSLG